MSAPGPMGGVGPGALVVKAAAGMWPALGLDAAQVFVAGMLAFGGLTVVLTQLEDAFVDPGHLTSAQFAESYAESAFAPGPNGPIFLALLSVQAFGLVGVPVVVAAWAIPSLTITHQLGRLSQTTANAAVVRLLSVLRAAVVGLVFAGMLTLVRAFDVSVPRDAAVQGVIAVVGFVLIVRFKVNPLWVLGGAMAVGAVVF